MQININFIFSDDILEFNMQNKETFVKKKFSIGGLEQVVTNWFNWMTKWTLYRVDLQIKIKHVYIYNTYIHVIKPDRQTPSCRRELSELYTNIEKLV